MSPVANRLIALVGGFAYTLLGLSPVWADDTEIYFGGNNASGTVNNVLFILDTSGSMTADDDNNGTSRMDDLKTAFKSLVSQVHNVNVGVMRFSNPGGPVLYPVSYIDKQVNGGVTSFSAPITTGNNDGYQFIGSGAVQLTTAQLELGANAISGVTYGTSSTRIQYNSDDAESFSATDYSTGGNVIDTPTENGSTQQINGFRFRVANIPAGATIVNAYMELEVASEDGSSGPIQLSLVGERRDNGDNFSGNNRHPRYRLENRQLTSSVGWTISQTPAIDDWIRTPDISNIIQEMVAASGTSQTTVVTLLVHQAAGATFNRRIGFSARDRDDDRAARLVVQYYTGTPVTGSVVTALRFENVDVPRGAVINSASIEFKAATTTTTPTTLTVQAERIGHSPALTTAAFNFSGRTKTAASAAWTVPNWDVDQPYSTPVEFKDVVQEVVSNAGTSTDPANAGFGWCGGNAMTFLITGNSGRRLAQAYENGSANAPVLKIEYDTSAVTAGSSCSKKTTGAQIANNSDDAEQRGSTVSLGDSTLDLVASNSSAQRVGLVFRNIKIPRGSKITSAYVEFTARSDDNSSLNLQIAGQAIDNAPTFASQNNNISSRATTSSTVAWNSVPSWNDENKYLTPDIAAVIQQIVDRTGWVSGNNLALIVSGTNTSSRRRAYSRNDSASKAPRLIINYIDKNPPEIRTVRDELLTIADSLSAAGNTPIQDTLYEAALYYRGMAVDYGRVRGGSPYAYTRVSHPESMVPGTFSISPAGCANSSNSSCAGETISGSPQYKAPIDSSCQKNYVVLLTDGRPNSPHSKTKITNLVGSCTDAADNDEACVTDLADWMRNKDMSGTVDGDQNIVTHTIGFNIQDNWLARIATAGGGNYYEATDAATLAGVFETIVGGVQETNSSFVAAGTAVNAFNRTLNRDELFFAVFQPKETPRWPGNLKKYRLDFQDLQIKDADGNNAVDETGFFAESSRSFWSASDDGPDVTKGGAGGLITDYTQRNLYTYLDLGSSSSRNLTMPVNEFASVNTYMTQAMFGVSGYTPEQFADLIDWVRGRDVFNEDDDTSTNTRYVFADPLHSRPVAVTYGGTEENPDISVFISTNSGFLHAIDNDDGTEQFGFIPQELLPIQETLYINAEGGPHPNGLDGSITPWVIDPDNDGVVLNSSGAVQSGNKVWLFVGMRRGGRNYYALDVTNRSAPQIKWVIKGGVTPGFTGLGQTWSQPIRAEMNVGGTRTKVLIFGGGYDPAQDDTDVRATDGMGAAVYIVNADTGELVWSGGNGADYTTSFTDMRYSIPAGVTGADVSGDGLIDFFFVGDLGGQVWRFDVRNGQSGTNLVRGGVIADLGVATGTNTAANNRRFYHSPSLFVGMNGNQPFLGVAIGSGYRAHPLNEDTTDRFYMIRQYPIFTGPATYTKITEANLFDATSNVIGEGTAAEKTAALAQLSSSQGWYITMPNQGEKVLSTPLIAGGQIFFNTYQPGAPSEPCKPATGINRSYVVSAFDATAVVEYDNIDGLTASDRSTEINTAGIVDQQRVIYQDDGSGKLLGGKIEGTLVTEPPAGLLNKVNRIYWYEGR